MGQRSQIYVRWNTNDGKKFLVPRYYQWNFGTRMISRAKGILEWLKGSGQYLYSTLHNDNVEKLRRIMDVNFDYKDVVLGRDIIDEWFEFRDADFSDWVFTGQDNNDGQLFIDMIVEWPTTWLGEAKLKFKYAFIKYSDGENPMNGNEYMQWDVGCDDDDCDYKIWTDNPYIKKEIKYTQRNIAYIEKNAELMTKEEIKEFREYSYVIDMGLEELPFT